MELIQILRDMLRAILQLEAKTPAQTQALNKAWDSIKTAAQALGDFYGIALGDDPEDWD